MRDRVRRASAVLFTLLALAPAAAGQEVQAGPVRLTLGGWLHAGYTSSSVPGAADGFAVRRGRMIFTWRVNDFVEGRLQPDFAGGRAVFHDAFVRFRFSPAVRVSLGQFKRAFDRFALDAPPDQSLIALDGAVPGVDACRGVGGVCSFGRLTDALRLSGRDVGVRVEGAAGPVAWLGTLTNGTGINVTDENDAKSFSGRLDWRPVPRLRVGGQLAAHDHPAEGGGDARYADGWSVDAEWGTWRRGLHVETAVAGGENWRLSAAPGAEARFLAAQGVAFWHHGLDGERVTGLEPLLRVSWADPDRDADADEGVLVTPGFTVYVGGRNKVGVNLDVYAPEAGDTEASLKVQAFLVF